MAKAVDVLNQAVKSWLPRVCRGQASASLEQLQGEMRSIECSFDCDSM